MVNQNIASHFPELWHQFIHVLYTQAHQHIHTRSKRNNLYPCETLYGSCVFHSPCGFSFFFRLRHEPVAVGSDNIFFLELQLAFYIFPVPTFYQNKIIELILSELYYVCRFWTTFFSCKTLIESISLFLRNFHLNNIFLLQSFGDVFGILLFTCLHFDLV